MNQNKIELKEDTEYAWNECLSLWKTLSEIPDTYTIRDIYKFKDNVLLRIRIGKRLFGCPFCSRFYNTSLCPVGNCAEGMAKGDAPCFDTPYNDWNRIFFNNRMHSQKAAKDFYEYLLKLKETYDTSGRFNTTTKLKIVTPYGNILKVTHYSVDEEPYDDYRIRPKCHHCNGDVGCVCFNYDNSVDPLQSATKGLLQEWCCEKTSCFISFLKENHNVKYKELKAKYGNDEWSIVEAFKDELLEDNDNIFCET